MPGRPVSGFPAHAFWDWSCDVYRRPGVEAALLDLQDRLGLDVNLLLFAGWTAATGRGRLSDRDWARLIEETAEWRANVVEPLRAVRRYLKNSGNSDGVGALLEKIKALELDSEHVAQLAIAGQAGARGAAAVPAERRIADASANLRTYYLAAVGWEASRDIMALLESVARTCCGLRQVQG